MDKGDILPTHVPAPSRPSTRRPVMYSILASIVTCLLVLSLFRSDTVSSAITRFSINCNDGEQSHAVVEPSVLKSRSDSPVTEDAGFSTDGRSGYNRREEEDGRSGYNRLDTSGRSGYNKREESGRSGYNSVDTSGRSGYNKREVEDGRSGYNGVDTSGRSGYNKREDEDSGRSGYNRLDTSGRSGYNRAI